MGDVKNTLGDPLYESLVKHYPIAPGFKEETTSREAAGRYGKTTSAVVRRQVIRELKRKPQTADEVATSIQESILSVRPRLSELRKLGKIEPSGERRRNESGMMAKVWRVI